MSRATGVSVRASFNATLAAALGFGLVSCGGKATGPDAGGGAGGGGGAGAGGGDAAAESSPVLSHGACDLVGQDCPDGTRCDFFCDGQTASIGCRLGATGAAPGQACSALAPCTKGTGCLAPTGSGVMCRPYCNSDGDCPTGRCHVVTVNVACGAPDGGALVMKVCF
jgi:hypothetical protein